jgi:hypothetical protein
MLNRTYKAMLMAPILAAVLTMIGVTQFAEAQSSDWTMTVNIINAPFGANKIFIEAKGPFGADLWRWVPNQVNPSTSFSMSGSQFPEGYNFQLCGGTGILASILPPCSTLTHTGGDQTFTWTFNWMRVNKAVVIAPLLLLLVAVPNTQAFAKLPVSKTLKVGSILMISGTSAPSNATSTNCQVSVNGRGDW